MADIRGPRSTMPAFVIVLFSYLCLSVVTEVGRTRYPSVWMTCIAAIDAELWSTTYPHLW